jgi:hypothetical protein
VRVSPPGITRSARLPISADFDVFERKRFSIAFIARSALLCVPELLLRAWLDASLYHIPIYSFTLIRLVNGSFQIRVESAILAEHRGGYGYGA